MPPRIDMKRCIGCGTCLEVCPAEVFELMNDKSLVAHPSLCVDCRACLLNCPQGAIHFKKK